jgi:hypothetical protein
MKEEIEILHLNQRNELRFILEVKILYLLTAMKSKLGWIEFKELTRIEFNWIVSRQHFGKRVRFEDQS